MKRNIVTTIEFSKGYLSINVLENISNSQVEIYSSKDKIKKAQTFLSKSLKEAEKLIGGSIKDAVIVIEESKNFETSISLVKQSISIAGDVVSKKDIDNLIDLAKQKNQRKNEEIVMAQPILFEVVGALKKQYSKAPIHKKGNMLSATIALTHVSIEALDFIKNIVFSQKISISQILLKSQTVSQIHLSEHALNSGASLININDNSVVVSINKNYGTISTLVLHDSGYSQLIKDVARTFKCDKSNAKKLLTIYGSLEVKNDYVVYTDSQEIREIRYMYSDLKAIIEEYISKIIYLSKKFLSQKGVEKLPVVLSGKATNIEGFNAYLRLMFENSSSVYNPVSYVECDKKNHNSIGFVNWSNKMDEIFGKQFNTIVETNPNTISSLINNKKSLWVKIVNKIGGKYDWNN